MGPVTQVSEIPQLRCGFRNDRAGLGIIFGACRKMAYSGGED